MIVFSPLTVKTDQQKIHSTQVLTLTSPTPAASGPQLVLASTSSYRYELLQRLRHPFVAAAPGVDERPNGGETPSGLAARLAHAKAHAVRPEFPSALIIGCDQTAAVEGTLLGKPGDHAGAVRQLRLMRGKPVFFFTALCLLNARTSHVQQHTATDIVRMGQFSDAQIDRYLEAERPYDCTGSARIEGLGITLVEKLEGEDPTSLIGLPLLALCRMLRSQGLELP